MPEQLSWFSAVRYQRDNPWIFILITLPFSRQRIPHSSPLPPRTPASPQCHCSPPGGSTRLRAAQTLRQTARGIAAPCGQTAIWWVVKAKWPFVIFLLQCSVVRWRDRTWGWCGWRWRTSTAQLPSRCRSTSACGKRRPTWSTCSCKWSTAQISRWAESLRFFCYPRLIFQLPEPEDSQSETSEAPSETPSERSLPPDISLQRKEKIVKMFSTKSSAFDRNAATYYDAVSCIFRESDSLDLCDYFQLNNASIGTKESRKG